MVSKSEYCHAAFESGIEVTEIFEKICVEFGLTHNDEIQKMYDVDGFEPSTSRFVQLCFVYLQYHEPSQFICDWVFTCECGKRITEASEHDVNVEKTHHGSHDYKIFRVPQT